MFLFPKTMILNGLFDKLSMPILRHVLRNKFIKFGEKSITAKKSFISGDPSGTVHYSIFRKLDYSLSLRQVW